MNNPPAICFVDLEVFLFGANFGTDCPFFPNGIAIPEYAGPHNDTPFDFCWIGSFKRQKQADRLLDDPERYMLSCPGYAMRTCGDGMPSPPP